MQGKSVILYMGKQGPKKLKVEFSRPYEGQCQHARAENLAMIAWILLLSNCTENHSSQTSELFIASPRQRDVSAEQVINSVLRQQICIPTLLFCLIHEQHYIF